jgi:hypothetical protein
MDAEIGNELVAMDVKAGECFGLNEVATDVWRSLAEPKRFDQLRDELLDNYEVTIDQCTNELRELLDDMAAKGLIEQTA